MSAATLAELEAEAVQSVSQDQRPDYCAGFVAGQRYAETNFCTPQQAAAPELLRECRLALDALLKSKPMLASFDYGVGCASLGNLRAVLGRPSAPKAAS